MKWVRLVTEAKEPMIFPINSVASILVNEKGFFILKTRNNEEYIGTFAKLLNEDLTQEQRIPSQLYVTTPKPKPKKNKKVRK